MNTFLICTRTLWVRYRHILPFSNRRCREVEVSHVMAVCCSPSLLAFPPNHPHTKQAEDSFCGLLVALQTGYTRPSVNRQISRTVSTRAACMCHQHWPQPLPPESFLHAPTQCFVTDVGGMQRCCLGSVPCVLLLSHSSWPPLQACWVAPEITSSLFSLVSIASDEGRC